MRQQGVKEKGKLWSKNPPESREIWNKKNGQTRSMKQHRRVDRNQHHLSSKMNYLEVSWTDPIIVIQKETIFAIRLRMSSVPPSKGIQGSGKYPMHKMAGEQMPGYKTQPLLKGRQEAVQLKPLSPYAIPKAQSQQINVIQIFVEYLQGGLNHKPLFDELQPLASPSLFCKHCKICPTEKRFNIK